jgi:anti-sigma regulatory factor (Ser/Thr protein kinase)
MLRAVPVTAVATLIPPPGAGPDGDGSTLLDRDFGADSLAGLRAAVLECASAAGLPDDRAMDVMFALHELAANTVRHGPGRGRLRIDATPRTLRGQVSDAGPGVVTTGRRGGHGAGDASGAGPEWPVRPGHGLWLIRRTADLVHVTSGPDGTVVTVSFNLPAR